MAREDGQSFPCVSPPAATSSPDRRVYCQVPRVLWDCVRMVHLVKNALAFMPRPSMRAEVTASLRAVFDAPDRAEAERQLGLAVNRYRAVAPKLAEWLEGNVPEGLAVFALPTGHRR